MEKVSGAMEKRLTLARTLSWHPSTTLSVLQARSLRAVLRMGIGPGTRGGLCKAFLLGVGVLIGWQAQRPAGKGGGLAGRPRWGIAGAGWVSGGLAWVRW